MDGKWIEWMWRVDGKWMWIEWMWMWKVARFRISQKFGPRTHENRSEKKSHPQNCTAEVY